MSVSFFLDMPGQYQELRSELDKAFTDIMESGRYILGKNVAALEEEIAELSGCKYGLGLNSGTDALLISLAALGIGPGDEVITTPFTFVATVEVICLLGATPVIADIDLNTFNLDPESVRSKITPRTKAIMPVHLFGQTADMGAFIALSKDTGIPTVADGAQAIGARYSGKPIGPLAPLTTLSFYPTKNLGACGDAGMILTDDAALAEQVKLLRAHGAGGGYTYKKIGYCSRLDELQAAFLRVKLPHLEKWNDLRRKNAALYRSGLAGIAGLDLPQEVPGAYHVYHQFTVRVSEGRRDALQQYLKQREIGTMVYYPQSIHLSEAYAFLGHRAGDFPQSERASEEVLCLPVHQGLHDSQVGEVSDAVRAFFQ